MEEDALDGCGLPSRSHQSTGQPAAGPCIDEVEEDEANADCDRPQQDARGSYASDGWQATPASAQSLPSMDSLVSMATNRIRSIEAVWVPRRVQTEDTVSGRLFRRDSWCQRVLFYLAIKGWQLWSMWWIGAVIGILALSNCIPAEYAWVAVLMLPLPIVTFLALSIDLMKEVLLQFEFYLIFGLQVHLLYSVGVIIGWDARLVFWLCYCPSMMVAAFMDAFPSKFRPLFSKMFFSGLGLILASWAIMLTFGFAHPIRKSTWSFLELEGNTMSSSLSSVGTLFIFCCRHFFVAWFHPDHFVIIVSEVRTLLETVSAEIVEVDGVLQPTGKYMLGDGGQIRTQKTWSMRDNELGLVEDLCRGAWKRPNPRGRNCIAKVQDNLMEQRVQLTLSSQACKGKQNSEKPLREEATDNEHAGPASFRARSPAPLNTSCVLVQPSASRTHSGGTSHSSARGGWPLTPEAWFSKAEPSCISVQPFASCHSSARGASCGDGQLHRALSLPPTEAYAVSGEAVTSPGYESSTKSSDSTVQDSGPSEVHELRQCEPQLQQQQHQQQQQQFGPQHQLQLQRATIEDAECPLSATQAVHESQNGVDLIGAQAVNESQDEAEFVDAQAAASTVEVRTRLATNIMSHSLWSWCACNKVDLSSGSR
mmetsp:Transcript_114269/g.227380  ORF Transcript_114269/g.227380 Transcript_114269/m.227380 type:complete len:650 (-) Transcript_114269:108-2057(-)